jgi:uncharacterized protein
MKRMPRIDERAIFSTLPDEVRALLAPETPHSRRGHRSGTPEARISARGGEVCKQRYGPDYMATLAKLGGEVCKERHTGTDYYARIGRRGGESTKERHGTDHYSRAGKKSAALRARRAASADPAAPEA